MQRVLYRAGIGAFLGPYRTSQLACVLKVLQNSPSWRLSHLAVMPEACNVSPVWRHPSEDENYEGGIVCSTPKECGGTYASKLRLAVAGRHAHEGTVCFDVYELDRFAGKMSAPARWSIGIFVDIPSYDASPNDVLEIMLTAYEKTGASSLRGGGLVWLSQYLRWRYERKLIPPLDVPLTDYLAPLSVLSQDYIASSTMEVGSLPIHAWKRLNDGALFVDVFKDHIRGGNELDYRKACRALGLKCLWDIS